jgi:hypothetical protein
VATVTAVKSGRALLLLTDGSTALFSYASTVSLSAGIKAGKAPSGALAVSTGRIATLGNGVRVVEDGCEYILPAFPELPLLTWAGDELLFCPDACTVVGIKRKATRVLCRTDCRIANLCADTTFQIVAVSTVDGKIGIYDLGNGEAVRSADVGHPARLLAITPKWGYVVAISGETVSVLTVNGELIKKVMVELAVIAWWTFSSKTAFDFFAVESTGGKMWIMDAFCPENFWQFYDAKEPVSGVIVESDSMTFVIVTRSGHIKIIAHPPIE